ncbi:MAG: delta-lactam-biosynthetic de-N-acetylase [Eubacteriales bacterium]|jgi:peptidoglycan-N-acetylmuramic acid deacetylase|nr:delta-lactam-biosynthetic de-N-acetylase [Eubacteriales bacterium]
MYIVFNKKKVKKLSIFLAAILVIGGAVFVSGNVFFEKTEMTSVDGNWGLSFQRGGKMPTGNATAEYLKGYNSYYGVNTDKKVIFLTFDAGYENGYTAKILDVLKKEKVPAAFFLVGNYIKDNKELVARMESEGHIVGNHTMTHPNMSEISTKESFQKEIEGVEALYKEATSKEMKKFYRPPQGKYSENNLKHAKELGYTTVFWSLAYVDWLNDKQPSREEAMSKLIPRMHNGAILLLHSTSKTNSEILGELIGIWKEEGYTFLSLDDLGKV